MNYLISIFWALLIFPVIALLITIPFMLIEYHKYGSINKLRTLIIYSFILYLIIIYFLVILPLPSKEEVLNLKTPIMNLKPFNFIRDILKETSFQLTKPSTYLKSLTDPCIYIVIFNIILTIPLGIYLRYYFQTNLLKTIFLSFSLSLFFELTQLTGLYFIYSRPYRLFDVDDLILNTFGGLLGYLIATIFLKILPSRSKIDEDSYQQGKNISGLRRITCFGLDMIIYCLIYFLLNKFIEFSYLKYLLLFIYYLIIPYLTKGYTLGSKFLNIKLVFQSNLFFGLLKRFIFYYFYGNLIPMIIFLLNYSNSTINFLLVILSIRIVYLYLINIIILLKDHTIYYDKYLKVTYQSTI